MSKLYFPVCKRIIFRLLPKNKDTEYETRVISLREVQRLRNKGVRVCILGTVNRIIVNKKKVPVKVKLHAMLGGPQSSVRPKGGFSCSVEGSGDSKGGPDASQSVSMIVSGSGGSGINYSCYPFLEQAVYVIIEKRREDFVKEKRKLKQQEHSLKQQMDKLINKEKELDLITEKLSAFFKAMNGKDDSELKELLVQDLLPVDKNKLLSAQYEESLLMKTMINATESFLGPDHILIKGTAKWLDYHVLICLLFYLHVNHYGNPSLLYGLRSKFFYYFKKEKRFKTLRSYRQFAQVTTNLLDKEIEFDQVIKNPQKNVPEKSIGRISLYQWSNLYWDLSKIFEKHIF